MLQKFYQKKKAGGFTLVELMIVVAIIGILAAIAIPAFLRYIKQSKTSEAEAIMKKIAEGSKAYFTSEQKFAATSGVADQPWHPGGSPGATNAAGLPVPFTDYVFPGGSTGINTSQSNCAYASPAAADAPSGGSKQLPCAGTLPAVSGTVHATLNKLRVELKDPLYFLYAYDPGSGTGTGAAATVTAMADFKVSGSAHTIAQTISVDATQEVVIGPAVLTNEFE